MQDGPPRTSDAVVKDFSSQIKSDQVVLLGLGFSRNRGQNLFGPLRHEAFGALTALDADADVVSYHVTSTSCSEDADGVRGAISGFSRNETLRPKKRRVIFQAHWEPPFGIYHAGRNPRCGRSR